MASDKVMMSLDIGSGWVRAAVGSLSKDGQLVIESLCERSSEGVRNGVVVDVEQTFNTIHSVMQEAELQAGREADVVVVGVGGQSVSGHQSEGVAGINAKGFEITNADIFRSLEVARTFNLPADRTILHTLVQDFTVDGKRGIKDPLDMVGHRLESRALVVTGSVLNCSNTKKCVQRAGVSDCRLVASMIADSESVLSTDDKELGTILINIGSDCTDMIAYVGGAPVYIGAVDFGSSSLTGDLAYAINKPKQVAEQLKCENGCCFPPAVNPDDTVLIPQVPGCRPARISKADICSVLGPRMAEIFSLLQENLIKNNIKGPFGGGVVLVGGGALLSGVTDLASEMFGMQARIGFPEALSGLDRSYISPQYTTVLGLLKVEAKKAYSSSKYKGKKNKARSEEKTGFFHKMGNFFKTVV